MFVYLSVCVFILLVTLFLCLKNIQRHMLFAYCTIPSSYLVWFIFYIANFSQPFGYFLTMLLIIHLYVLVSITSRLVDSESVYPKYYYLDMFLV